LRQRAAERSRFLFQDFLRAPFAELRLETDIDASLVAVGDLSFSRAFLRTFLRTFLRILARTFPANFFCELFSEVSRESGLPLARVGGSGDADNLMLRIFV
jgi:hypothetical protein